MPAPEGNKYAEGNDGGRPSTYNPSYINAVDKYLKETIDEEVRTMFGPKVVAKLPTIEDFAIFIKVPRRTVYAWREEHEEFAHALDKILAEQQKRLLNKGLSGQYNPTIAKLVLSANHGMRERTDLTTDNKPLPPAQIIGMRVVEDETRPEIQKDQSPGLGVGTEDKKS